MAASLAARFVRWGALLSVVVLAATIWVGEEHSRAREQLRVDNYAASLALLAWGQDLAAPRNHLVLAGRMAGYRQFLLVDRTERVRLEVRPGGETWPDRLLLALGLIRPRWFAAPVGPPEAPLGEFRGEWLNRNVYWYAGLAALLGLLLAASGLFLRGQAASRQLSFLGRELSEQRGERLQAEARLELAYRELRQIFDQVASPMWLVDREGRVQRVNRAFVELTGRHAEELEGRFCHECRPSALCHTARCPLRRVLAGEKTVTAEIAETGEAGASDRVFLAVAGPYQSQGGELQGMVESFTDLTARRRTEEERRELEERLRQMQKMEALGALAGGIAHDFNNILAVILGYAELGLLEADPGNPARSCLEEVLAAGQRAKQLVQQILSFSRRREQDLRPLDPEPLIKEVLKFLRATLPSTIAIEPNLAGGGARVKADPSQIHQLLMNLCANAAHAMRERGGRLAVELARVELDQEAARLHPGLAPGPHLRLSVSDTGHGMDRNTQLRIFEPFFTTKQPGEGTGMGLAVVHGIVKALAGAVTVYSESGRGTSFHIHLPLSSPPTGEAAPKPAQAPPPGRGERVLFVDDEPDLAAVGERVLTKLGYRVTALTDSREALARFTAGPHDFQLLITDLTMPGLTGPELAREVHLLNPGLPIVLCTGFSHQDGLRNLAEFGIMRLLAKPLLTHELAQAVREALAAAHPEEGGTPPPSA